MKLEINYNVKLKGKFVIDLTLVIAVIQLLLSVLNWQGDKPTERDPSRFMRLVSGFHERSIKAC